MDSQLHFLSQQGYKLTFPGSYYGSLKKSSNNRLSELNCHLENQVYLEECQTEIKADMLPLKFMFPHIRHRSLRKKYCCL